MNFLEALESVFRKKFDFTGRASRSEYWWFVLAQIPIYMLASLFLDMFNNASPILGGVFGLILLAGVIFMLITGIALSVRRFHDSNHSGWMLLLGFIPIVGGIITLIYTLLPSDDGANNYGSL